MADSAKTRLDSIADKILGENPIAGSSSTSRRIVGLGERAASMTESGMEASIRGIKRSASSSYSQGLTQEEKAAEKAKKIEGDMATWMAAIKSAGIPEDTGTPQLDYYVGEDVDASYDTAASQASRKGGLGTRQEYPTDSAERKYPAGTPNFVKAGSNFRNALKSVEAEGYDTLFGHADSKDTPFKGMKVTNMSVGEVLDFVEFGGEWHTYNKREHGKNTTALGKYQIVGDTLRDLAANGHLKRMGITSDTKFDRDTQDKIATYLARRRVVGKSDKQARKELVKEWQGLGKLPTSQLDAIIQEIREG